MTTWPAPQWSRSIPPNVELVGGPWNGRIVPLQGVKCIGPTALFSNGYMICVGSYEWRRDSRDRWYGEWRPNVT